jgi:hypothetical protein
VIDREAAVRIVEEELAREDERCAARGVHPVRTVVTTVEEHEPVWIVGRQSEEFVRTGSRDAMLIGVGPYLVDRVDGGLHRIGVLSAMGGDWEADYRVRIRGQTIRTAVDDLHDELRRAAAAHGTMTAVRVLRRRLADLTPAQALAYVRGLLDGEVPAPLVAVAVQRLVEPLDPVLAVTTVRPGGTRPTG